MIVNVNMLQFIVLFKVLNQHIYLSIVSLNVHSI